MPRGRAARHHAGAAACSPGPAPELAGVVAQRSSRTGLSLDLSVPVVGRRGRRGRPLQGDAGGLDRPRPTELMVGPARLDAAPGPGDRPRSRVTIDGEPGHARRAAPDVPRRRTARSTTRTASPGEHAALRPARRPAGVRSAPTTWRRSSGPFGQTRATASRDCRREPRAGTRSPASPATAARCSLAPGRRRAEAPRPRRWSPARPTCCARRGTSPTGCGWSTARAAGARSSLPRAATGAACRSTCPGITGERRESTSWSRATAPGSSPSSDRRGQRRRSCVSRIRARRDGRGAARPGPGRSCVGGDDAAADPRHRLALADRARGAQPR